MISDIERGEKSPTIATLAALAEALRIPISGLVDAAISSPRRIRVVRAFQRTSEIDKVSGAQRDSFGPAVTGSRVEFLRLTMPPRATGGTLAAHERGTIEHVHVAAGKIRFDVGADSVLLGAGDSCSCLADAPHSFDNRDGDVEALIYIVVEPP